MTSCRGRVVFRSCLEATKEFDVSDIILRVWLAIGTFFWSFKNEGNFFEFWVSHKEFEGTSTNFAIADAFVAVNVRALLSFRVICVDDLES